MSLSGVLQGLAAPTSEDERNPLCRQLLRILDRYVPWYVHRQLKWDWVSDDLMREAIHHVLIKATTGTTRFRGTSDGEANGWCLRIVRNYLLDNRPDPKQVSYDQLASPQGKPDSEHACPALGLSEYHPPHAVELSWERVKSGIDRVIGQLRLTTRRADLDGVVLNVETYLEHQMGATAQEQAAALQDSGTATKDARGMVYQHRRRGARAIASALDELVASGGMSPEEASDLAQILRVDRCRRSTTPNVAS